MDNTHNSPNYITVIEPVHEISIAGTADPSYWHAFLRDQELYPYMLANRAQIMISAISSRFRGLAFRELTVSVSISNHADGRTDDGLFLLHALNSSRLLAFAERTFFRTPYFAADVAVGANPVPTVQAAMEGAPVFDAHLGVGRKPAEHRTEVWEGPIYLPGSSPARTLFYARLSGPTDFYPFTAADTLEIHPTPLASVFRSLLDSGFTGELWRIREGASHARSKTVKRDQ